MGYIYHNLVSSPTHFENKHGKISMLPPCRSTFQCWEIYCLKGDLFEDTPRYDTEQEALNVIANYLKVEPFFLDLLIVNGA